MPARNSACSERIEQQYATIDVLKAMSVSPGDPQPVFDLIVRRARDPCEGYGVTVYEFDGQLSANDGNQRCCCECAYLYLRPENHPTNQTSRGKR